MEVSEVKTPVYSWVQGQQGQNSFLLPDFKGLTQFSPHGTGLTTDQSSFHVNKRIPDPRQTFLTAGVPVKWSRAGQLDNDHARLKKQDRKHPAPAKSTTTQKLPEDQ